MSLWYTFRPNDYYLAELSLGSGYRIWSKQLLIFNKLVFFKNYIIAFIFSLHDQYLVYNEQIMALFYSSDFQFMTCPVKLFEPACQVPS